MAQHSLAFTDILQKNIRHVYSGRPTHMSFRGYPPPRKFHSKSEVYLPDYDIYTGRPIPMSFTKYPLLREISIMELPSRIDEQQRRPPDRFRHKFEEYLPDYDISMPRAPAFGTLTGPEVDRMVDRLSRPNRRENRYDMSSRTVSAKQVSSEEMETIITRLMRPTKSSMVRIMMRRPNAENVMAPSVKRMCL